MNRCSRCHSTAVIEAPETLGRSGAYLKCLGCGKLFATPTDADVDGDNDAALRRWRERIRRHWTERE